MEDTSTAVSLIGNIIAFFICASPFVLVLGGIGLFVFMRRNKNKVIYAPSSLAVAAAGIGAMPAPAAVAEDAGATLAGARRRTASISPSATLAPSELILFNGEQFAKKTLSGNVELLHLDQSVSAAQLGQAILAAAILACEQAGAVRLEVRQTKALFGLTKADTLFVDPAQSSPAWPTGSLELRIRSLAEQLQARKGKNDVASLVYALLAEDSSQPWQQVMELVKAGLAGRGLLEVVEEKKLKLFTVRRYILPEASKTLIQQQALTPIQQMVLDCERNRPQIWQTLTAANSKAVKRRTKRDNSHDFDNDFDFD